MVNVGPILLEQEPRHPSRQNLMILHLTNIKSSNLVRQCKADYTSPQKVQRKYLNFWYTVDFFIYQQLRQAHVAWT